MDNVTLFSVFRELLLELGASQIVLARYTVFYKVAYNVIKLMIAVFMIINTVFAFTEQVPLLKQIFQVINLVAVSGLLGNFGVRAESVKSQMKKMEFVHKTLLTTMAKLGLGVVPQPAIVDNTFLPQLEIRVMNASRREFEIKDLGALVKQVDLRAKLVALHMLIQSHELI